MLSGFAAGFLPHVTGLFADAGVAPRSVHLPSALVDDTHRVVVVPGPESVEAAEPADNGDLVSVRSNGTSVELRARVNRKLVAGVVRVADEHAGDLHREVEVVKA